MRRMYKIDENNLYVEDVFFDDTSNDSPAPENYIELQPPTNLIMKKWDQSSLNWVEGATQEYIDSLNVPPPKTEIEQLQEQQADLIYQLMMEGVL
jgi:hypothetical protein